MNGRQLDEQMFVVRDCGWLVGRVPTRVADRGLRQGRDLRMLVDEYKLRLSVRQQTAIDEAIRTTQFVRNKALRLWMNGHGVGRGELQALGAQLAQEFPFAARLNSMARQAAADRAWQAIARFYANCREKTPGKKG